MQTQTKLISVCSLQFRLGTGIGMQYNHKKEERKQMEKQVNKMNIMYKIQFRQNDVAMLTWNTERIFFYETHIHNRTCSQSNALKECVDVNNLGYVNPIPGNRSITVYQLNIVIKYSSESIFWEQKKVKMHWL